MQLDTVECGLAGFRPAVILTPEIYMTGSAESPFADPRIKEVKIWDDPDHGLYLEVTVEDQDELKHRRIGLLWNGKLWVMDTTHEPAKEHPPLLMPDLEL